MSKYSQSRVHLNHGVSRDPDIFNNAHLLPWEQHWFVWRVGEKEHWFVWRVGEKAFSHSLQTIESAKKTVPVFTQELCKKQ